MANPSKAKGTAYETEVVNYLNDVEDIMGKAERTGSADFGAADIHQGDWTFECKAEKSIDLPGYLKQLAAAVTRSGRKQIKSAVWVKNRRHSVDESYVVTSGENYAALMLYIEYLEGKYNG